MYRQGDVLLRAVESLPEMDEKKVSSVQGPEVKDAIILALGEASGHSHAIRNASDKAILVKSKNENKYFLMVVKEACLTHEEHNAISLPKNNYQFIRQRQYLPEGVREVAD